MKKVFFFILIISLSCSLTEPSTLIIKNNSDYNVDIFLSNSSVDKITLYKNKGDVIYTSPGEIKIIVSIDEINFIKNYSVNISAFEKKKFEFSME